MEILSHKDRPFILRYMLLSNFFFLFIYLPFAVLHRTTHQPIITSTLRIHDTCGVHNLHGMPAVISAIFSAIYATLATADTYKDSLTDIFPGMAWKNATNENGTIISSVSICQITE